MSDANKEKSVNEQESYQPVYDFHFYVRLHLCWLLAVIAIFLGPAWWFVPLPGYSLLPPYRTYPSTVLKLFFEGLAVILATRSLIAALIKVFTKGIYPDSVIKFRTTGGIEAIYSGIRYRSGLRYFLIASLLPVAGLLGNLLQAELQSSSTVFYHLGKGTLPMEAAQCQPASQYDLASTAFSKGLITHSLSDASSILDSLNSSIPYSALSLIDTQFAPILDISVQPSLQNITSVLLDSEPLSDLQSQKQSLQTRVNATENTHVFRHSSSNGTEAIVVLSDLGKGGFYLSSQSANYTCFAHHCIEYLTSNANSRVVADALAQAMRSNTGAYGTLVNDVLSGTYDNSGLADALFVNPLCTDLDIYMSSARPLSPYTRATWSILAILWSALLVVAWAIGAYLIGYTIDVFYRLALSGNLLNQIWSTSTLFVDGELASEKLYLNWEKVELLTDKDHPLYMGNHSRGYTVTTEEL